MEWLSPTLLTRMDTSRPEVSFSRAWKSESLFWAKSMARIFVCVEGEAVVISEARVSSFEAVLETSRMLYPFFAS